LPKEYRPYSFEDIFFDVGDYKSDEQGHHKAWESARIQCCNPGVENLNNGSKIYNEVANDTRIVLET
jgi:hypothetical protein